MVSTQRPQSEGIPPLPRQRSTPVSLRRSMVTESNDQVTIR